MYAKQSLFFLIAILIGMTLLSFGKHIWESTHIPDLTSQPKPVISQTPEFENIKVKASPLPPKPIGPPSEIFEYIEIIDGCDQYFVGTCINIRSGPGTQYPVVSQLRNGVVLRVSEKVITDEQTWYKVKFDDWLRFPDRVWSSWYISGDFVRNFEEEHVKEIEPYTTTETNKKIIVDRSEQMLYAYDGDILFMQQSVSTGVELTPTPRGSFTIYKKIPSRYMQGPLEGISDDYYDLPGVPWNMYFTRSGAAIHGTYWHNKFGSRRSHGCVNLPPDKAEELYQWTDLGTQVIVQD